MTTSPQETEESSSGRHQEALASLLNLKAQASVGKGIGRQRYLGPTRSVTVDKRADNVTLKALEALRHQVRVERMEFVLPVVEAMDKVFREQAGSGGAYADSLTVESWMKLLNQWEKALKGMRARQLQFALDFFGDAQEKARSVSSPLLPMLFELLRMLERHQMDRPILAG
ncbi:MAG: hypothetical protein H7831_11475 [Magnetococcus sp. WYHC-3]